MKIDWTSIVRSAKTCSSLSKAPLVRERYQFKPPYLFDQQFMQAANNAATTPIDEIRVDGFPRWKIVRQVAPLHAVDDEQQYKELPAGGHRILRLRRPTLREYRKLSTIFTPAKRKKAF
jgi:hypothetical protein